MSLSAMMLSAIAAAVGAIMYWSPAYLRTGFRQSTVRLIPMIVRALGFVVSSIVIGVLRGPVRSTRPSTDRQLVDSHENSSSIHQTPSSHVRPVLTLSIVPVPPALTNPLRRAARQTNEHQLRREYAQCT
jgi:hypothetical protein